MGWHARREQDASQEGSGLSRRTLTKGAVWATPLLATSVAAPAYAASGPCVGGQATLVPGTSPLNVTFPPSTVTASVVWSSTGAAGNDQTPGETSQVKSVAYSPSWNYLKLHLPKGMDLGDTVTLTLNLNQAVSNLSLTITDIDQGSSEWIDNVIINTLGFTVVAKGANVIGAGTASGNTATTGPFRSSVNANISSAAGDLTLKWAGPLSQVQITYRAADTGNSSDIGQHIGVGKIGFTC